MRVLTILVALVLTAQLRAAEADAAALRARAALALAFAAPPRASTYPEAYARAAEDGKPLVVFVGQPVREVAGCVCVGVASFPGAERAVVVGVPAAGGFRRVDLPGRPDRAAIRTAITSPPPRAILPPATRCDGTTCGKQ